MATNENEEGEKGGGGGGGGGMGTDLRATMRAQTYFEDGAQRDGAICSRGCY